MPTTLTEIEAVFVQERFRFQNAGSDDCVIGVIDVVNGDVPEKAKGKSLSMKAFVNGEELTEQLTYRLYGRWGVYKNKGTGVEHPQFQVKTFIQSQPHGRAGVIAYLTLAGKGKGIGFARAKQLWDKFKSDAVRIAREEPEIVEATLKGVSIDQAEAMSALLKEWESLEACTIDLIDLLKGRGFPKATAKAAVQQWGNQAAARIKRNPYLLMNFRGCGFKRCDAMYLDLGLPPDKLKRQTYSAWYELASDMNGNTWMPVETAIAGIQKNVSSSKMDIPRALLMGKRGKVISYKRTDETGDIIQEGGQIWAAETRNADQEELLAELIADKLQEESEWPSLDEMGGGVTDHQREQLKTSTSKAIGIFRGGPGTGKSFSTAALVRYLLRCFGVGSVLACAPTNKAAHRLTQALGDCLTATSIHRLLGVVTTGRGDWMFYHNEERPLLCQVLIVDEGSMPSTSLMLSLLRAVPRGCLVLIVGDTNQLPPIQHGAPMRDMLASGLVPNGELTEPQRNAGRIVQACDEIRRGVRFTESTTLNKDTQPPENFKIVFASNPQQQLETLMHCLQIAKNIDLDPIWDCQAMVAVNEKSSVSRKAINDLLQRELNSGADTVPGNPFRIGDKVVCKENGMFTCAFSHHHLAVNDPDCPLCETDPDCEEDEEGKKRGGTHFVCNGEFGKVVYVQPKFVDVLFPHPDRWIRFLVGGKSNEEEEKGAENFLEQKPDSSGSAVELGYAATVHKCQGSEFPMGLPILDASKGAKFVCSREWFFTAISRGKLLSLPIGVRKTADAMVRNVALSRRKTFLSELIQQKWEERK